MFFNRSILVVLIIYSFQSLADDSSVTPVNSFATPNTCIARTEAADCEMEIDVTWTFSLVGDYCLYQDETAVKCWKNVKRLQDKMTITVSNDISLSLKDVSKRIIKQQKIKVVYATSQQFRRKLKSEWSIF